MRLERKISDHQIEVWVADYLVPLAEDLLDKLVELDVKGPKLKAGSKVAFGWTLLTISDESAVDLEVREPSFSGDPMHETTFGVNDTLSVLAEQLVVNKSVHAEPHAAWYTSQVLLEPGVLDEDRVYLHRRTAGTEQDSGWYIGSIAKKIAPDSADLERMPVWQVFVRRRELLKAMALPVGYIAVLFGSYIDAILDAQNNEVYQGLARRS